MQVFVSFLTILVLFVTALPTGASDLAEAAKKEKARREALKKEGTKAKVLTNADVVNLKSSLGIESTKGSDATEEEAEATEPNQASKESADNQNAEIDEKIKVRREEIEKIKKEIQEMRGTIDQSGSRTAVGSQFRSIRESEELIQGLEKEITELEAQKTKQKEQ